MRQRGVGRPHTEVRTQPVRVAVRTLHICRCQHYPNPLHLLCISVSLYLVVPALVASTSYVVVVVCTP